MVILGQLPKGGPECGGIDWPIDLQGVKGVHRGSCSWLLTGSCATLHHSTGLAKVGEPQRWANSEMAQLIAFTRRKLTILDR